MAARVIEIAFLANVRDLEAQMVKAGVVADDMAKKFQASATTASRAAAAQAKAMGASADEQAAAAGRAAAAFTEASGKMSAAQKAAGDAAARTARAVGASADEQASAYRRAAAAQAEYEAGAKKAADSQAAAAAGMGKLAAAGKYAGLGLAAAGVGAAHFASAFETAQASVQGATGLSEAAAKRLTDAFAGTAFKSVYSGQQMEAAYAGVARQLQVTEGHMLSTGQATRFQAEASNLAEAAQIDLGSATGDLAGVMQAYHIALGGASDASNILFNTSKATGNTVDQVAQAVNRMHGRLGALAPSLKDVASVMVEFAQHGLSGSRALLAVNTAFQTLASGSSTVTKVLQALGVSVYNSRGQFIGVQGAIEALRPKLAGLTQQQQVYVAQSLFGKSAGQAMLQVIRDGIPAYQQATGAVTRHNAAQKAAEQQSHTLHGQYEELKSGVETLAGAFGIVLIPAFHNVAQAVQSVIGWIEKHTQVAKALAGVITGVLGTALAAYAYTKAVAFVSATKSMVDGVIGLAGKLTGLLVPSATTAATSVSADAEEMAVAVVTADGRIVTANSEAAASFASLRAAATGTAGAGIAGGALGGLGAALGGIAGIGGLAVGAGFLGPALFNHGHGNITPPKNLNSQDAVEHWLETAKGLQPWAAKDIAAKLAAKGLIGHGGQIVQHALEGLMGIGSGAASLGVGASTGISTGVLGVLQGLQGTKGGNAALAALMNGTGSGSSSKAPLTYTAQTSYTPTTFAIATMMKLGIAPTPQNVRDFTAWEQQEGGNWNNSAKFNPLNTTMPEPGAGNTGVQGNIKVYTSWAQGLAATVATLKNGLYGNIFAALKGNASLGAFSSAVAGSQWGTGGINASGISLSAAQINRITNGMGGSSLTSKAAATATIPAAVAAMLSTAQALVGAPYTWGGGHSGWDPVEVLKKIGIDCSGFVSRVLHAGGVLKSPLDTEGLASALAPGKGRFVTVWDRATGPQNNQHTIIDILGKWFESGGKAFPGGVGQMTAAQATQELAGGGFRAYHPNIKGGMASTSQLAALGLPTTPGALNTAQQQQANIGQLIAAYIQKVDAALKKTGDSLLKSFGNAAQTGSPNSLMRLLGVSTTTKVGENPLSKWLDVLFHGPLAGGTSAKTLLATASAGSQQSQAFTQLVDALNATHSKALHDLADKLVAAHKAALAALSRQLYAQQLNKDAESLNLQATELRDQATKFSNWANDMLQVQRAEEQKRTDAAQHAATVISDQTQTISDRLAAMAQSVQDSMQTAADAASSVAQGINDQTQIQVDILGERGLYGLNLLAQQQQVAADEVKAYWDQQIALQQQNVDSVTAQWHAAVATAQLTADNVQLQQDNLVAQAQQNLDTVNIEQAVKIAAAQAKLDALTAKEDAEVIGPAQIAADMGATLPKAQQDVLNAQLKHAEGVAGVAEGKAQKAFNATYATAQSAIQTAQNTFDTVSGQATQAIGNANQVVTTLTGLANIAIGVATGALSTVTGEAGIAEAGATGTVAITQAKASTQFAGSGLVVNITGINPTDANAIASEVGWAIRTSVPA